MGHLHRIGKLGNPSRDKTETVEHLLLECKNYKESRKDLRKRVSIGKMKVARLLGYTKILKHTLEACVRSESQVRGNNGHVYVIFLF